MSEFKWPEMKATPYNQVLFEIPVLTEEVDMHFVELAQLPPNDSPLRTGTPMGVPIDKNIMYMMSTDAEKHAYTYLHHAKTGQRFQIVATSKKPRPKRMLHIGAGNFRDKAFYCVKPNTEGFGNHHSRYAPDGLHVKSGMPYEVCFERLELRPVYFISGGAGLLCYPGVTRDLPRLLEYSTGDILMSDSIKRIHRELIEELSKLTFPHSL